MESTTTAMQQAGWEFSVEQDFQYMALRMIGRHQQAQMYIVSEHINLNFFAAADNPGMIDALVIYFPLVSNKLVVTVPMETTAYQPADMAPQFAMQERKDIEDYGIFATPLVRTNEIIVPEETVGDLLDRLLEYQEPSKAEYMKHKLRENREGQQMDVMPQQKFHAQILSIAA